MNLYHVDACGEDIQWKMVELTVSTIPTPGVKGQTIGETEKLGTIPLKFLRTTAPWYGLCPNGGV